MVVILKILIFLVGIAILVLASLTIFTTIKIVCGSSSSYRRNKDITGGLGNVIMGKVDTYRGGTRDYRVSAGMVYSSKEDKWISRGAISDASIDSML